MKHFSDAEFIHIIATGLQATYDRLTVSVESNRTPDFAYLPPLQRALNVLELKRLGLPSDHAWRHHVTHFPELVRWGHTPLADWPLEQGYSGSENDALLRNGVPTQVCDEWAISNTSDVSGELQQREIISNVMEVARGRSNPHIYSQFRELVTTKSVLTQAEVDAFRVDPVLGWVHELIQSAYSRRPPLSFAIGGYWHLCGVCGGLKHLTGEGSLVCERELCHRNGSGAEDSRIPTGECLFWLNEGLRRYTFIPGQAELKLTASLTKLLPNPPELWPEYDQYDHRFLLPNGQIWVVDVKDWHNPFLLAAYIRQHADRLFSGGGWNRAYIVVPVERVRQNPDYLTIVRNHTAGFLHSRVKIMTDKQLIAEVRAHA